MGADMEAAPVLSTPDSRILEATDPVASYESHAGSSDDELSVTYDIERTLREIREARYKRVALQFPDDMLPDAPRVFQLLSRGLRPAPASNGHTNGTTNGTTNEGRNTNGTSEKDGELTQSMSGLHVEDDTEYNPKLFILGDTSYGACCVDEVAAEHVDADVVVHYGRACLSPTARLPVIYVFTRKPLSVEPVVRAFKSTYPDPSTKLILAADVTYAHHVPVVYARLQEEGYTGLFATEIVHHPSSAIPNRTVPEEVREHPESLAEWQLFHLSEPPTALLLTLASRVSAIHIYPTDQHQAETEGEEVVRPLEASTAKVLRRRYAILTSLSTVPIFGILINTLSVKNYLHIVDHVKQKIAQAGKKSYMFVVGKLNAAKVANFSEIGGWVVIGCWESSLVDSKEFWKPVITPFELELALQGDTERIWTGAWQSDFQTILDQPVQPETTASEAKEVSNSNNEAKEPVDNNDDDDDGMSEPESAPPEFDLRTGRYVSHSRPMRTPAAPRASTSAQLDGATAAAAGGPNAARALARRANGDLAMIGGTVSPGAEFLRSQRTWKGLGSDFDIRYDEDDDDDGNGGRDTTLVVEGRKGIARGYTVGEAIDKH